METSVMETSMIQPVRLRENTEKQECYLAVYYFKK